MKYFNHIAIEHYKGIKALNISRFAFVNLITGPNGSGKTSFAEGLEILTNPKDFSHYVKVTGNSLTGFTDSFDKREPRPYTKLSATILENPYTIEIASYLPIENQTFIGYHHFKYPVDGTLKTISNEITLCFAENLPIENRKPLLPFRKVTPKDSPANLKTIWDDQDIREKVISLLSLFDDEIYGFHTEDFHEYFIAHQSYGNLKLEFFSEGIQYFLKIAEQLSKFQNGVLVIDALDYQFAKNTVYEVVNFIYKTAKERQIQLFITTQSAEMIDEWLDLMHFYNDLSNFKIFRFRSDKNHTSCMEYEGPRAYQLRLEENADFRNETIG